MLGIIRAAIKAYSEALALHPNSIATLRCRAAALSLVGRRRADISQAVAQAIADLERANMLLLKQPGTVLACASAK